ncbi:MAG: AraC family transcriptional regulator [Deltaproteobacteria bacterium]|nr:AraC family transcriptional regulator [Deltaproteobacteria bacterium]
MNDDIRAQANYYDRFRRVLVYIDNHLQEAVDLEELSHVAAFSKFHFHRQWSQMFGITVAKYIQLRRLKRAAFQLAFRSAEPVLHIAFDSGFEGPEAFARAFKRNFGQTPSEFRAEPEWQKWQQVYATSNQLREAHMSTQWQIHDVKIINFSETPVAALTHTGDPQLIGDSIRRFIEWRKQNRLPPRISATFNLVYDDPDDVDPTQHRMDLCAATNQPVLPNEFGVVAKTIPAGRCAVLRHVGSDDTLRNTVGFLYRQWLPQSGHECRDFPLFFQRVSFFPDVPEHEAITDVFLPLR